MFLLLTRRLLAVGIFFLASVPLIVQAKEFPLRNDSLAYTEQGRQLLKYIVKCALPETDNVFVSVDGVKHVFPGKLGLAPDWIRRSMTDVEKRKLSACMAAHTNFFKKTVEISLRSDDPLAPAGFRTTAAEREAFPFFEGGFFGNYFIENSVSYVCLGDLMPERDKHLEDLYRVCSVADSGMAGFSLCRFKIVGKCSEKPFLQEGVDYSGEVLWVYLPAPSPNNAR